jgi:putative membrane protein
MEIGAWKSLRRSYSMWRARGSCFRAAKLLKFQGLCFGLNRPVACGDRWIVQPCGWMIHGTGAPKMILQSLAGLPAFLVYFCTALVAVVAYLFVYTRVTPHDELQLIRDNVPAAAIALGLSLLGFVLPVVSAIAHSANVVDCLIWSLIALIVQIVVYYIVKIPVPNLSSRIAAGELAPAIWLGLSSLAAGALNAASMIY